ncbi:PAS domain S-box-containing protein [Methanohalophilus levihalophilus]|uniref:PAS domain-containing protein n=1 Tax=Methanohalophilus levihalophilus TaxID=1431282 RepID=UPI001AE8C18D|nr:PAS domain-containing protein [Methanohalophilus levihalophilus]MBP2029556.1 PAS domain S-box-containing protein [Methanohalophilus levihalophilus]
MEKQANVCCQADNMEIFHSFVQSSDEAIILTNSKNKVIFWNKKAEDVFQYSEDEIYNKEIAILIPEKYSTCLQTLQRSNSYSTSSTPSRCTK